MDITDWAIVAQIGAMGALGGFGSWCKKKQNGEPSAMEPFIDATTSVFIGALVAIATTLYFDSWTIAIGGKEIALAIASGFLWKASLDALSTMVVAQGKRALSGLQTQSTSESVKDFSERPNQDTLSSLHGEVNKSIIVSAEQGDPISKFQLKGGVKTALSTVLDKSKANPSLVPQATQMLQAVATKAASLGLPDIQNFAQTSIGSLFSASIYDSLKSTVKADELVPPDGIHTQCYTVVRTNGNIRISCTESLDQQVTTTTRLQGKAFAFIVWDPSWGDHHYEINVPGYEDLKIFTPESDVVATTALLQTAGVVAKFHEFSSCNIQLKQTDKSKNLYSLTYTVTGRLSDHNFKDVANSFDVLQSLVTAICAQTGAVSVLA